MGACPPNRLSIAPMMQAEISKDVTRIRVSAPEEGEFGARGIRDLALGVVVVCCSERRTPLSGFQLGLVGRANCSFRLQKMQRVSADSVRARAGYLERGVVAIRERRALGGTA